MKHPLLALTGFFCLGIIFATIFYMQFWLFFGVISVLILLSFFCIGRKIAFDILLILIIFVMGGLFLKKSQQIPACHINNFYFYQKAPCLVKGVIIDIAEKNFVLSVEEAQINKLNHKCCGKVLVLIRGKQDFSYGEELLLKGRLYRPFPKGYRNYLASQEIFLLMSVKSDADIIIGNKNKGFFLKRCALFLKNRMEDGLEKQTSVLTSGILEAMVLGEKKNISPLVYASMVKTGTVHILVVSGFNVGIVVFIIMLILKLIRLPRLPRTLIAIFCLLIYCIATGASTPVVRATIMGIFFLCGYLIKREPDIYNSLSVSALFILILNPRQLFDIGFQLSFVSVLAIVFLYPKISMLLRVEKIKIRFLRSLVEGMSVSFSAWLGTAGIIAYYFRIFSPVTVVANLFIVPLATILTLCGFSLLFVNLFLPLLSPYFAVTAELASFSLIKINSLLVNIPFSCLKL